MIKYPESKVQVLPEETEFSVRISHTLTSKFMETIQRHLLVNGFSLSVLETFP